MEKLTMKQLLEADFRVNEESPILRPFDGSFVVADPSLLTPDVSHDKKMAYVSSHNARSLSPYQ